MKKKAFVLFGAPGSGKGTQGELLEKRTGFRKYVMSSLIKEELKENRELAEEIMKEGKLLDDEQVLQIFERRFENEDVLILDGIPRTNSQAKWIYEFLKNKDYKIFLIYVKVDENKLLDRILKRAQIENRIDDNAQVFKRRLSIFDESRDEILKVFEKNIIEINGDLDIVGVSEDFKNKVGY